MADEPELSRRPLAVKLTWWNRAILDVLGLAGLGAGAAAVFITHLEAGPVALIAAGLLLLLIGIGGHMPSRLKVGDNEAQWEIEREAVQVFVERVTDDAPAERQPELLDALGQLAEGAPKVAAPALSGFAYETSIIATMSEAVNKISDIEGFSTSVDVREAGEFDLVIQATGNRAILVEVKASSRLSMSQAAEIMGRAHLYRETYPDRKTGLLLVSRYPLTPGVRAIFSQTPKSAWVVMPSGDDAFMLTSSIKALLDELGS